MSAAASVATGADLAELFATDSRLGGLVVGLFAARVFGEPRLAVDSGAALLLTDRLVGEMAVSVDLGSEGFFGADMGGILQELYAAGKDLTRSAKLGARLTQSRYHQGCNRPCGEDGPD